MQKLFFHLRIFLFVSGFLLSSLAISKNKTKSIIARMRNEFVNTRKYFGGSKFKFSCFTAIANDFFGEGGLRIDFEST